MSWLLAWRGLRHHWPLAMCAALGIAVATATVVGALILGDSLRGTLRERLDHRLGPVEQALIAPRPLRPELAGELGAIGLRQLSGTASTDNGATAPATVLGVDDGFRALFPDLPALPPRSAAVTPALAHDLGLKSGDGLVLTIGFSSRLPGGSAFTEQRHERLQRRLRVEVAAILPASGCGVFALDAGMEDPRGVYLDRAWLASALGEDRLDAVIAGDGRDLEALIASHATLADLGLRLLPDPTLGQVTVQGDGLVLGAELEAAIRRAASACGGTAQANAIHLADSIALAAPGSPICSYALLAACEGPEAPGPDGIVLSTWLAEDLHASVGDRVRLSVPLHENWRFTTLELSVRSLVPATGAAIDPALVPVVPGFTDVERIAGWDLPIAIEAGRISARDDAWWAAHRTAPKAFIDPATMRRLWSDAPGWVAGLRIRPPAGEDLASFAAHLEAALRIAVRPAEARLVMQPLRRMAAARSAGNADLAGLFLGLGMFVIIAGLALAAQFIRLQVERRAAEVGILSACGWSAARIRRLLLLEGLGLAAIGALLGVGLGIVNALGLIALLDRGWAHAAVGLPLSCHVSPASLLLGGAAGFIIGALAAAWAVRALGRRSLSDLLAGWRAQGTRVPARSGRSAWLIPTLAALVAIIVATTGCLAPEAAAGVSGAATLVALCGGLLLLARWLRQRGRFNLALAEAVHASGRSLLVVGVMACSAFILILVAAQQRSPPASGDHDSPTGGYALRVTTALPLPEDLNRSEDRAQLGFSADDERDLREVGFTAFLVGPGDDISCRNPAKPAQPRLLGCADPRFLERGGFGAPPAAWTALANGGEPIPVLGDADSLRWTLGVGSDGILDVHPDGIERHLRVVGTFPSSVFAGELLLNGPDFRHCLPGITAPRLFLATAPAGRVDTVARILRQRLAPLGVEVRTTGEVVAAISAVRDAYLALFLALGGLGLLLGTAGLAVILARSAVERRGELALLASLGFRPLRVLLGGHAVLLGCGLGVGCLAALVASLADPPAPRAWLAVLPLLLAILATGQLSAVIAARWAIGRNLVQDLRHE